MTVTRLFPASAPLDRQVSGDESELSSVMRRLYEPPSDPWIRINLIASIDGSATGSDGTSNTLTSRVDRLLLTVIRSFADVVVVGAATARREGYRMPRAARLAVVTSTGELDGHRIQATQGTHPLLVLCPESAVAAVRRSVGDVPVEIVTLPALDGSVRMNDAVAALKARSLHRVLCEGGPNLAAQFLDARLVDEICLTTAPVVGAGRMRLLEGITGSYSATLTQLLIDDAGYQFARWSLIDRAAAAPPSSR